MRICSADHGELHTQKRSEVVTSTDMVTILGLAPESWNSSVDDIIKAKRGERVPWPVCNHSHRTRTEEECVADTLRRTGNGNFSEAANIQLFGQLVGAHTKSVNDFFVADSGKHIGASVDGYIWPPSKYPTYGLTSNDDLLDNIQDEIRELDLPSNTMGLLEAKQSSGWKAQKEQWAEAPYPYHVCQVQTQLYVTGLPYAVIFCRLGVDDWAGHVILPDEFFWEAIESAVAEFWERV